jgi:hypothetical protein
MTREVCSTMALESEATTYSSSPTPMISGEPLRAQMSVSGSSLQMTAMP